MSDGSNAISEKDFITGAIEFLDEVLWNGIVPNYDAVEESLDKFLKYHHEHFHEVEFIRKEREDEASTSE